MDEHYDTGAESYVEPESYADSDYTEPTTGRMVDPWDDADGQDDADAIADVVAPDDAVATVPEPDIAELPADLQFGSALLGPDGTTDDSYKEPYEYKNSSGTYESESGRTIDPWTSTEIK